MEIVELEIILQISYQYMGESQMLTYNTQIADNFFDRILTGGSTETSWLQPVF